MKVFENYVFTLIYRIELDSLLSAEIQVASLPKSFPLIVAHHAIQSTSAILFLRGKVHHICGWMKPTLNMCIQMVNKVHTVLIQKKIKETRW